MTDANKTKIYQKCRHCEQDFGTRGIRNHEAACARKLAAAETPPPAQIDPVPEELETTPPDEPKTPQLKPLKLLPIGAAAAEATEMTEETLKTATGNTIKIIKDIANPATAPNAAEPGIKNALSDAASQAKMISDLNNAVKTDGMQKALTGLGNLLEASAEKLRGTAGKAAGGAPGKKTEETEEQKFLRLFEQGLV